jgi:leader peptidase (prepilin peptidase)/N-methyltransferase
LRFDEIVTIITTRSRCAHCKKEIPWYDLVPLLSYIALFGKCRFCKKEISIQYPLVEVGTALTLCLLFWQFGFTLSFFAYGLIFLILIVVFAYDILHLMIPDSLMWLAIGIWIIYLVIGYFFGLISHFSVLSSIYGALVLGGFLALLVVISKEKWMGAGDIKIGALLGAMIFWPQVLVSTFLAFTIGAIVGLFLIAIKKKKLQGKLPFAPFLILGTLIALIWGEPIIVWYLGGIF